MDFIEVFNTILKAHDLDVDETRLIQSYDQTPIEVGLDSLDMVMVTTVLADIYGISESAPLDTPSVQTVSDLRDFVNNNKTKQPSSLEEVAEWA
jgi:acyl carrier protein